MVDERDQALDGSRRRSDKRWRIERQVQRPRTKPRRPLSRLRTPPEWTLSTLRESADASVFAERARSGMLGSEPEEELE